MQGVFAVAAMLALVSGPVLAQGAEPARVVETSKGKVWADAKGMTLYTFDRDGAGKSNCTGECARTWPPFLAGADAAPAGAWTVVSREGGAKQWAYKGKPLYGWIKDGKPGDVTGEGVNNLWRLARP